MLGDHHLSRVEDSIDYLTLDDLEKIPVTNLDELCHNIVYEKEYHLY